MNGPSLAFKVRKRRMMIDEVEVSESSSSFGVLGLRRPAQQAPAVGYFSWATYTMVVVRSCMLANKVMPTTMPLPRSGKPWD